MTTVLVFLVVISFLVLVHEFGHLMAAKLTGVWVHKFSVGFGPSIFTYKTDETDYSLSPLLFGGYVRMAGEDVGGEEKRDEQVPENRKFYSKHPAVKGVIAFSGPAMNVFVAVLMMIVLAGLIGVPYIGIYGVMEDYPAQGLLQVGDKILSVDGSPLNSLTDLQRIVEKKHQNPIPITVLRDGKETTVNVEPRLSPEEDRYLLGVELGPFATNEISEVLEGAPYSDLGLRGGDKIVQVGEVETQNWPEVVEAFAGQGESERITITVNREGEKIRFELPPGATAEEFSRSAIPDVQQRGIGPLTSINQGLNNVKTILMVTYRGIRMVIAGDIPASEAVSGPVGIATYIGRGLDRGFRSLFFIVALVSLNLGIVNMIPFPALDGSRIGFAIYEWIRGRPIPPEKEGMIHSIGFMILIGLLIFLTYQDIVKLLQ